MKKRDVSFYWLPHSALVLQVFLISSSFEVNFNESLIVKGFHKYSLNIKSSCDSFPENLNEKTVKTPRRGGVEKG